MREYYGEIRSPVGRPSGAPSGRSPAWWLLAVVVLGTAFAFVLAAVLRGGGLVRWDQAVDRWMYVHETATGDRIWSAITLLGLPGAWVTGVVVVVVLWRRREPVLLAGWVVAIGAGGIVEWIIKAEVDRARPPYAATFLHTLSPSFPSGHAFLSCTGYFMLVFVVHRLVHPDRPRTLALLAAALLLVVLVSFSRLYLAVHYPTDVIGGLLAGGSWLALCIAGIEIAESARARATHA